MKTGILVTLLILRFSNVYPQLRLGMELGVNTIYGSSIKNEYFNLSQKWNYSPYNIGYFLSLEKKKILLSVGYRGSALDGIYKVDQKSASKLFVDISYEYILNKYYFSYMQKLKNLRIGGNLSGFQIENSGFGWSRSNKGQGSTAAYKETNFNAPKKWYFVPALEIAYDLKIKGKTRLNAIIEFPLWRFSGYNIYYESIINNGNPESINITPSFYAFFLNLRIPIFTIGKNWNYFSVNPNPENKTYISTECPQ